MKTTRFLIAVMALAASVMINACKVENHPPCSDFDPGAIATAGQTVTVGGTPTTIHSEQDASGGGEIIYQWYKDGKVIWGANAVGYTPPSKDAMAVGTFIYTRHAIDDACNTTFTPSIGSWTLVVVCSDFSPGAIATAGQTVTVGGAPITINSTQNATSENGTISYQWYKNGNAISGATAATYTPPKSATTAAGTHTYTRHAKDNICNTTFTPSAGSWVLTVVCPGFDPGAIATSGQTVTVGGTPITINSAQNATSENGAITYQWYKNGNAISGATAASYTPPKSATTAAGTHTYTRHAKDICNTTFTPSAGSWVLTIVCPSLSLYPGAIATAGQTVTVGGTPITIHSEQNAIGPGSVSYQWYKNGQAINGATVADYTPPTTDAAAVDVITYTRKAKETTCDTTLVDSDGSWVLTVTDCSLSQPAVVGTFADFPSNYSASTYVTLTDERDNKNYRVVKIGGRWIMAQNLNYQKDLTWQVYSYLPTTSSGGQITSLIGHFWCPGGDEFGNSTSTSTRASCEVWGALYSWETAMMVDGKWSDDNRNTTTWIEPSVYFESHAGRGNNGHGICPQNWHVPIAKEWGAIINEMEFIATPYARDRDVCYARDAYHASRSVCSGRPSDENAYWLGIIGGSPGTDALGLRILPAGERDNHAHLAGRGRRASLWCGEANSGGDCARCLVWGDKYIQDVCSGCRTRSWGLSVRCMRDL